MTQSLRILYVGTLPPHPGGSAYSAYQLLGGLTGLGHLVRSLAPVTSGTSTQAGEFDLRHPELQVTRYCLPQFDAGLPIPTPPAVRAAEELALRTEVPRLIAAHRPHVILAGRESYAWVVPHLARRYGVPSVLLLRGGGRTTALLEGRYPPELARQFVARCRLADRLVAVSRHLAEGFARLGLEDVQTILNFVDLERFAPRPRDPGIGAALAITPDKIVVMHLAYLTQRKRPMDLVESAAAATRRDRRLVYVIVGDGPLRAALERRCAAEGLAGRFRFVGWVDYDRVPGYLSVADLVVMPSQSEGLARAYVETMACGRVLVASDIPPAREVVDHGATGLLFPLEDTRALAATTLHAAADPGLRARIGEAARCRARLHALDAAVRAYAAVLEEAARGR